MKINIGTRRLKSLNILQRIAASIIAPLFLIVLYFSFIIIAPVVIAIIAILLYLAIFFPEKIDNG